MKSFRDVTETEVRKASSTKVTDPPLEDRFSWVNLGSRQPSSCSQPCPRGQGPGGGPGVQSLPTRCSAVKDGTGQVTGRHRCSPSPLPCSVSCRQSKSNQRFFKFPRSQVHRGRAEDGPVSALKPLPPSPASPAARGTALHSDQQSFLFKSSQRAYPPRLNCVTPDPPHQDYFSQSVRKSQTFGQISISGSSPVFSEHPSPPRSSPGRLPGLTASGSRVGVSCRCPRDHL